MYSSWFAFEITVKTWTMAEWNNNNNNNKSKIIKIIVINLKYKDRTIEIQRIWNVKTKVTGAI
jgi:hypothetical protein